MGVRTIPVHRPAATDLLRQLRSLEEVAHV